MWTACHGTPPPLTTIVIHYRKISRTRLVYATGGAIYFNSKWRFWYIGPIRNITQGEKGPRRLTHRWNRVGSWDIWQDGVSLPWAIQTPIDMCCLVCKSDDAHSQGPIFYYGRNKKQLGPNFIQFSPNGGLLHNKGPLAPPRNLSAVLIRYFFTRRTESIRCIDRTTINGCRYSCREHGIGLWFVRRELHLLKFIAM